MAQALLGGYDIGQEEADALRKEAAVRNYYMNDPSLRPGGYSAASPDNSTAETDTGEGVSPQPQALSDYQPSEGYNLPRPSLAQIRAPYGVRTPSRAINAVQQYGRRSGRSRPSGRPGLHGKRHTTRPGAGSPDGSSRYGSELLSEADACVEQCSGKPGAKSRARGRSHGRDERIELYERGDRKRLRNGRVCRRAADACARAREGNASASKARRGPMAYTGMPPTPVNAPIPQQYASLGNPGATATDAMAYAPGNTAVSATDLPPSLPPGGPQYAQATIPGGSANTSPIATPPRPREVPPVNNQALIEHYRRGLMHPETRQDAATHLRELLKPAAPEQYKFMQTPNGDIIRTSPRGTVERMPLPGPAAGDTVQLTGGANGPTVTTPAGANPVEAQKAATDAAVKLQVGKPAATSAAQNLQYDFDKQIQNIDVLKAHPGTPKYYWAQED